MRERERGLGQNGESKCLDGRHKGPARTHLAVFLWRLNGAYLAGGWRFFFLVTISRRWRRRKKKRRTQNGRQRAVKSIDTIASLRPLDDSSTARKKVRGRPRQRQQQQHHLGTKKKVMITCQKKKPTLASSALLSPSRPDESR